MAKAAAEKPKNCPERKINRHAPDFSCDRGQHSDAHRDPRTGQRWGHPETPYGMRKPHKGVTAHAKTKHGVYYSDKPASK